MMERQNVPAQALRTAELLEDLWDSVLGIYLYGSSVCGGLHPDSDIDLLMICGQEIPDEIRRAITARLLEVSGRVGETGRRPLEVTAVSRTTLDPWRFPPICDRPATATEYFKLSEFQRRYDARRELRAGLACLFAYAEMGKYGINDGCARALPCQFKKRGDCSLQRNRHGVEREPGIQRRQSFL